MRGGLRRRVAPPVPLSPEQATRRQAAVAAVLGRVIVTYMVSVVLATLTILVFVTHLRDGPGRGELVAGTIALLAANVALTVAAVRGRYLLASVGVFLVGTLAVVGYAQAVFLDAQVHLLIIGLLFSTFVFLGPEQDGARVVTGMFGLAAFLYVEFGISPDDVLFPLDPDSVEPAQTFVRLGMAVHVATDVALMQYRFAASRQTLLGVARFAELRATTDEMTGLSNRRPVMDRLTEWFEGGEGGYTVALVDVDQFKVVNDDLGHDCGDALIRDVAETMRRVFRESDLVSRWGGDEFLVLMPGLRREDASEVLERLRREVRGAERACEGRQMVATVSIGAAICVPGQTPDEVITAADKALYRAKESGRDRVVVLEGEAFVDASH